MNFRVVILKQSIQLVLTLFISFSAAFAQQNSYRIYGRILDDKGKPLDQINIALYTVADSIAIKTTLTEENGKFSLLVPKLGQYLLKASLAGQVAYQSKPILLKDGLSEVDLNDIIFEINSIDLKEIVISSKKAFSELKSDRIVINVDALVSNTGISILDVLAKSPGVAVDGNGLISLKGKSGVNVYVDDKPTYMSGNDLENYLRSLPSSSIEQIELITNPSAKYDAAGNAGVINIKTKKSKVGGFNGTLNLSLNQGKLTRLNNSLNLNYYKNKINAFANFSYNLNNSFIDLELRRIYKNEDNSPKYYFNQNTYLKRNGNTFNTKAGLDFYQTSKTTWGFVFNGTLRQTSQTNRNTSNLLNAFNHLDSLIQASNDEKSRFDNANFNLNYRHKFGKETGELTFDLDYLNYSHQTEQQYYNYSYFPDMSLKYADLLTGELPSGIDIYSAKVDFSKPLKNNLKLETGIKSSHTITDNVADYNYTIGNTSAPDFEKTNHFVYKENINAAYVNLNSQGKKLTVQAGLRFENTHSNGHQLGNPVKPDSVFNKTYNHLFPTFYLSYKLDTAANNQIGLNFGRRVDRPSYRSLNPFYMPLDKFTYYLGNPFLKPTFTNVFELSYTHKNKFTTTISYSSIKDQVTETIEIVDGTYYSRPGNIGSGNIKTISVNAELDFYKWLTLHAYGELSNVVTKTDFYTGFLTTNGTYFRTTPNLQIKINPSWNAEVNFLYHSRFSSTQFVRKSVSEFGAAIQKKLSAKSNLKFNVTDIFCTRVYVGTINNLAATTAGWVNKSDSRNFILTYSYRFGKMFSTPKKYNLSGADAEKQRAGS